MTITTHHGACALDCPDTCAWTVTVDGGVPIKLRGRADHPNTRGGLCPKMNSYLDYSARDDRLLQPLRRVGDKGEGRFAPISWDEALDEWSSKWREILDTSGGDAIWPFAGTGNLGLIQGIEAGGRLFNTLGLANHHASICSISGYVGLDEIMGSPTTFDPEELPEAGVIILWGHNPVVASVHLMPIIERAKANGVPIVCIDPVRTASAKRSDVHLAPRPGTDGALALGLMAGLLERGHVDHEFLRKRPG